MRRFALTAALGAACLGLAACGDGGGNNAAANGSDAGEGNGSATGAEGNGSASGGTAGAASSWPKGARIVEEGGVTYRVDPDGTRVRLEDQTRIVVENGVRYRVEPGGTRVRINDQGLDIDIDTPDVDLPDVDVGINNKGNPDIDVRDPDGR